MNCAYCQDSIQGCDKCSDSIKPHCQWCALLAEHRQWEIEMHPLWPLVKDLPDGRCWVSAELASKGPRL